MTAIEGVLSDDWGTILTAMLANGFTEAARGRGYIRMVWPAGDGSLILPTDPEAPEYREMLRAVMDELLRASDRGTAAYAVLEAAEVPW